MSTFLAWIVMVVVAAVVFVLVIRTDRALDRRVSALEESSIDRVLDAVDDLCYPISDWERNEIKAYMRGANAID